MVVGRFHDAELASQARNVFMKQRSYAHILIFLLCSFV